MENLLGGPDPTRLPSDHPDVPARAAVAGGTAPRAAVPAHPASSLLWALLAEEALADDPVAASAYARTGYQRSAEGARDEPRRGRGPAVRPTGPTAAPSSCSGSLGAAQIA